MRGAITGKDVILNSVSILRLWGVGTWFNCVWATIARRPTTFLDCLYSSSLAEPAPDAAHSRWRPTR